ncbi:serine/threonine-protein kinase [Streptomyces beigongshangae]|uniref:serine/threonine-protein kinase n=1 Tax=Streptomyces beigongshangae TaxID=2841597 RepID=UPI0027E1113E|nr:serine/threonine-protein kinase [Streptomyces sp. REN17]
MGNTDAAANEPIAGRYRLQEVVHREVNSVCWYGEDTAYARPRLLTRTRLPPGGPAGAHRAGTAVARITHASEVMGERCPGAVARVIDVVVDDAEEPGGLWTVVEWIDGMPLGEFLDRHGVLDPVQAARLGLDILDVLESAHDAGLVHGELSLGQVFVRDHGGVVVSGYGLAGAGPVARIGAPAYASPEQARGEPYGAPADLWALGALLHTMTEGRPPFRDRGRPEATCKAIVRLPPRSPRRAGPLTELVHGLLSKDPYGRWTGPEAREVLGRVLGEPGDPDGLGGAGAFGADPTTAPVEVPRPETSPAFVSVAANAEGGGRRRSPVRAAPVGAAVVAAVAVAVTVLAVTGDDSGSGSPAPDAAATRTAPVLPTGDGIAPGASSVPSVPGATAPTGSPSRTASPSQPVPSPSPSAPGAGAGALPAGFRVFTAPEGFAVALPAGWERIDTGRARDGSYRVVLGADGDPRNLAVTYSTRVGSDPVAVWRDTVEPTLRQGAGYDRLGAIRATTYQGRAAADMEWVDEAEGTRVRTFGRGFLLGGGEGFSLRWTTPDAEWDEAGNQRALKTFLATFRGSAD